MTSLPLTGTADDVLRTAARLAGQRGQRVSGAHVLAAILGDPFPALSACLRAVRLRPSGLASLLDECFKNTSVEEPGVADFTTVADGLLVEDPAATGPHGLLRAVLRQRDPVVATFLRLLDEESRGFSDRLEAAARSATPSLPASPDVLGGEHVTARVQALLSRADALSEGRPITTRALLRAWLSDPLSLLSKALLSVGAYEAVLRRVGGKARPAGSRVVFDVGRCSEYLASMLQIARTIAATSGDARIDERSLALALLQQTRGDTTSELAAVSASLAGVETWLEEAELDQSTGDGEIPVDQIVPFLNDRVINQEHAIREVYRPVLRVRLGLGFKDALAAVLLFVGPPGVGKSYLAKLMAHVLYGFDPEKPEAHFVMIECGRYKDEHAVTDLLGAPHGYVGSDKGILRDGVRDKSPCVIVFDEAERMHSQMWDSLLTMFNDGVLRDNTGGRYPLTDCFVVLTSNAGIEDAEIYRKNKLIGEHAAADALVSDAHKALGVETTAAAGPRETLSQDEFWSNEDYRENYKAILLSAAQRHFGPALFNRIDEKIGFNGLRQVDYTHIAKNALGDVIEHLHRATGVRLWYHADVPQALAAEVLTRSLAASARDMNRLVRKFVLDDAFAPLKLKEIDGARLAPAYQIQVVTRGRNRAFDRVDLVPASAPAESSAPR